MSSVIDNIVVGILVLGAIAYAATTLGPRGWRARALAAAARLLARAPSVFGLTGLARRLSDKAAAKAGGACGGCDTCGSESAPGNAATSATSARLGGSPTPGGSNEVRIPVSSIGKRR